MNTAMNAIALLFHDIYETDPRESGFRSPAADRYKLSIDDFDAQLDGLHRIQKPVTRVPTVITFDDGGESYYTVAADRLEARGWRGHCFVTTECVGQRGFLTASQIRELDARGHVIGSHSASHPARFSTLPTAEMRREWRDSRQALEDLLGHPVTTASVPGGYFSRTVANAAAESGIRTLFTSEPTSKLTTAEGCTLLGRFTIRRGHPADMARRFAASPLARGGAWAGWNAKALVKPLLGPSYALVADWLLASKASEHHG
jgi:peptidoglycan/xylan/chitin deacetylase (PgdA/CDA1 family)